MFFDKVIVWGHKSNNTLKFINEALFKCAQYLQYTTYWFNDQSVDTTLDFDFSLFIVMSDTIQLLPINLKSYYLVHNVALGQEFDVLKQRKRVLYHQVYTHGANDTLKPIPNAPACCLYLNDLIVQPWCTDLTPPQITANMDLITSKQNPSLVNDFIFIGSYDKSTSLDVNIFSNTEQIASFIQMCEKEKVNVRFLTGHDSSTTNSNALVMASKFAPALVGTWQQKNGYIPCRLFKNISYGNITGTNCNSACRIFGENIIYHEDGAELFKALVKYYDEANNAKLLACMQHVKDNFTYNNWLERALWVFRAQLPK